MKLYDIDTSKILINQIKRRIKTRVDFNFLLSLNLKEVIIAGNSLNEAEPHDVDLYPVEENGFDWDKLIEIGENVYSNDVFKVLTRTKNALTIKYFDTVYQFCSYWKGSLEKLVSSFDFAHVQVGALIRVSCNVEGDPDEKDFKQDFESENYYLIKQVYWTEEHMKSLCIGNTFYVNSEFPINSLIRLSKYVKYGDFKNRTYIVSILKILTEIIDRGFKDYDDFKNQLDAVDLGLLEEDESPLAYEFYETCCSRNLVENPDSVEE